MYLGLIFWDVPPSQFRKLEEVTDLMFEILSWREHCSMVEQISLTVQLAVLCSGLNMLRRMGFHLLQVTQMYNELRKYDCQQSVLSVLAPLYDLGGLVLSGGDSFVTPLSPTGGSDPEEGGWIGIKCSLLQMLLRSAQSQNNRRSAITSLLYFLQHFHPQLSPSQQRDFESQLRDMTTMLSSNVSGFEFGSTSQEMPMHVSRIFSLPYVSSLFLHPGMAAVEESKPRSAWQRRRRRKMGSGNLGRFLHRQAGLSENRLSGSVAAIAAATLSEMEEKQVVGPIPFGRGNQNDEGKGVFLFNPSETPRRKSSAVHHQTKSHPCSPQPEFDVLLAAGDTFSVILLLCNPFHFPIPVDSARLILEGEGGSTLPRCDFFPTSCTLPARTSSFPLVLRGRVSDPHPSFRVIGVELTAYRLVSRQYLPFGPPSVQLQQSQIQQIHQWQQEASVLAEKSGCLVAHRHSTWTVVDPLPQLSVLPDPCWRAGKAAARIGVGLESAAADVLDSLRHFADDSQWVFHLASPPHKLLEGQVLEVRLPLHVPTEDRPLSLIRTTLQTCGHPCADCMSADGDPQPSPSSAHPAESGTSDVAASSYAQILQSPKRQKNRVLLDALTRNEPRSHPEAPPPVSILSQPEDDLSLRLQIRGSPECRGARIAIHYGLSGNPAVWKELRLRLCWRTAPAVSVDQVSVLTPTVSGGQATPVGVSFRVKNHTPVHIRTQLALDPDSAVAVGGCGVECEALIPPHQERNLLARLSDVSFGAYCDHFLHHFSTHVGELPSPLEALQQHLAAELGRCFLLRWTSIPWSDAVLASGGRGPETSGSLRLMFAMGCGLPSPSVSWPGSLRLLLRPMFELEAVAERSVRDVSAAASISAKTRHSCVPLASTRLSGGSALSFSPLRADHLMPECVLVQPAPIGGWVHLRFSVSSRSKLPQYCRAFLVPVDSCVQGTVRLERGRSRLKSLVVSGANSFDLGWVGFFSAGPRFDCTSPCVPL